MWPEVYTIHTDTQISTKCSLLSLPSGCIMNGLPVSVCQGCYCEAAGWDDLYTRGWWCEAVLGAAVTTHCYYRYVTSTSPTQQQDQPPHTWTT